MSYIGFLETQTHWTDESFEFWWFTGEVLAYESNFVDSSFPTFSLSFTGPDDLEHFGLGHWLNFLNRDSPLAGLFFTFLFDHVGEYFGVFLLLPVHEISWDGSFLNVFDSAFGVFLFVLLDGFLHLNFLFESFFVEYFGFEASECLGFLGDYFSFSGIFLSTFLLGVESLTETFSMKVNIVVLRHGFWVMLKRNLL